MFELRPKNTANWYNLQMVTHYVVNCVLIKNNEVLLEQDLGGTFWKLPGGHIDEEETPLEALERECKEELGTGVEIISKPNAFTSNSIAQSLPIPLNTYLYDVSSDSHFDGNHRHLGFVYTAKPIGEVQSLEHQQLKWFSISDLGEESINPVVKALCLEALRTYGEA